VISLKASVKKILINFSSLSFLQVANYLLPLITFPYLVRVLGPANYGLLNFAIAFASYFGILSDYGFNLSATREVSINRDNLDKLREIFNSVLIVKIFLYFLSSAIIYILVTVIPFFNRDAVIYWIAFLAIFGQLIFPAWFFQGVEEMKYLAIINVITKILVVISIFIFILNKDDYLLLLVINGLGNFVSGIIGLFLARKKFDMKFYLPNRKSILFQFKEGWHLFIFSLSTSLYSVSNTFILGLFANTTIVGYFAAADKIRQAITNIFSTISHTVYPYLNRVFIKSKIDGLQKTQKMLIFIGVLSFFLSLFLFVFADEIILFILGPNYVDSIPVLKIISWIIFLVGTSNVLGIHTMLNLNYKIAFTRIIVLAAFFNIGLSFILVPQMFEIGTAISVFITESIVTLSMVVFLVIKQNNFTRVSDV